MKTMILSMLMMVTTSAFATVTYQSIGGVPANKLCDAGDVFKTVNPVPVCTSWRHTPGSIHGDITVPQEWTCLNYENQDRVISKETTVCTEFVSNEIEHKCVAYAKGVQSSTVLAERVQYKGDITDVQTFNYTIKACN